MNDYFLSHASEDKLLVKKVYSTLKAKGRTCWFDQAEILPGDSLVEKVFVDGLKNCRFVILFLSKSFLSKEWPKAELETVIARQIRENKKSIVPFLIDIGHSELVSQYPYFESIYCGNATDDFDLMITQLDNLINRDSVPTVTKKTLPINHKTLPKDRKEVSQFSFEYVVSLPEIREVTRLVESLFVSYHRAPNDLKIDVIEFAEGSYYGLCNYGFWGPEQATPYKSLHPQTSVNDALNDALRGIHAFDSADYPNDLVFWVEDDDRIIDGNGQEITFHEAHNRRSSNIKAFRKTNWTNTTMNGGPWWLISKNFTTKEFAVIGPIDDDGPYIEMCLKFQEDGIDFRLETVPTTKETKESLETYFQNQYKMKLVEHEQLYNK
ncbi:MAG: toll/interleukin-1 receptor domain-containing protein [Desulfomonile tiedjei]|uniref:Toll/interleukin-1 receptor domain-containing protein n=1 Tax=Desulfomonile tiedjei TaxID=2358 RepID=A0A9D6V068_9BACT|nr:toll/interleukin-1 receptor domain-containing protein [Desulfomonile tiedjei]